MTFIPKVERKWDLPASSLTLMETFLFCWQDLPPAAPLHPLELDLAGSFPPGFFLQGFSSSLRDSGCLSRTGMEEINRGGLKRSR